MNYGIWAEYIVLQPDLKQKGLFIIIVIAAILLILLITKPSLK